MNIEIRKKIFAECNRLCKKIVVVAVIYKNVVKEYTETCDNAKYQEKHSKAITINRYLFDKGIGEGNWRLGLFYFTISRNLRIFEKKYNLKKIKIVGRDFLVALMVIEKWRIPPFLYLLNYRIRCPNMNYVQPTNKKSRLN